MTRYSYDGPVMEFDRIVQERYRAETLAVSKNKALSNLAYRWKKENGRLPGSRIILPGRIEVST